MPLNLESKIMADARSPYNPCIKCKSIGQTCGRYYNGLRQHQYGKGRGRKCYPLLVADLCDECDEIFQDGSVDKNDIEGRVSYSEQFQHWCLMSAIRRFERGILQ